MQAAIPDLAAALLLMMIGLGDEYGAIATVLPQNSLCLKDYRPLREVLLANFELDFIAALGPGAFQTISGEVVNVILAVLTRTLPTDDVMFSGIDVNDQDTAIGKSSCLTSRSVAQFRQSAQCRNPNSAIVLADRRNDLPQLAQFATVYEGAKTIDIERFRHLFWELSSQSGWKSSQLVAFKGG